MTLASEHGICAAHAGILQSDGHNRCIVLASMLIGRQRITQASNFRAALDVNNQKYVTHSLDVVVSNASNLKHILITVKAKPRHGPTVCVLPPPSTLLDPAESPAALPHTLVAAHQEG